MKKEKIDTLINDCKIGMVIIAISGIINLFHLFSIPSDPDHAIFLTLSFPRILLASVLLFGTFLSLYGLLLDAKNKKRIILNVQELFKKRPWITVYVIFIVANTFITWIACFSPEYFLGKYFAMLERLRPILLWVESVLVVIFLWTNKNNDAGLIPENKRGKTAFKRFAVITAVLLGAFLTIGIIYPKLTNDLWFGRYSVPILVVQIAISWAILTILIQLAPEIIAKLPGFIRNHLDLIVFIVIWLAAVWAWVPQPIEFIPDSYLTTIGQHLRPMAPTFEIFPWADSRTYYLITESIKMGNGIYRSIDKPLFLTLGSVLNGLTRGSFEKMLTYQTVLLATFPAVLYLIGKQLHSRSAGFLTAMLAIFQGMNGIQLMSAFPVVSAKVLLSEPHMQLWNALIVLAVTSALKNKTGKQPWMFLVCGGVLGLSTLIRLNTFILIPFLLLLFFICFFENKKLFLKVTTFFLIGLVVTLTPWMVHNAIKYDDPLAFINAKFKGVIVENRYKKINWAPADERNDDLMNAAMRINLPETHGLKIAYAPITSGTLEVGKNPAAGADLFNLDGDQLPSMGGPFVPSVPAQILNISQADSGNVENILISILRHFLNNVITSFSILPVSAVPHDLYHGARAQRFWGDFDASQYAGISVGVVVLNLTMITVGLASVIRTKKNVGLAPVATYLGYYLSNAIAISSGNRYTQPAAWVVLLYFAIGLAVISSWFINKVNHRDEQSLELAQVLSGQTLSHHNPKKWGVMIVLITILGISPVLADELPPDRFQITDADLLIRVLDNNPACRAMISQQKNLTPYRLNEEFNTYQHRVEIGKIFSPLFIDARAYEQLFTPSNHLRKSEEKFYTFQFLSQTIPKPSQLNFFYHQPIEPIENGSDVIIVTKEGSADVILLALLGTTEYPIVSDKILENASIRCFSSD